MECKALIVAANMKNMVIEDLQARGLDITAVTLEGCQTIIFKRQEAIEAWNRRA
jgi:hypothetical protein